MSTKLSIRGLTVRQPWASLLAIGFKPDEVRCWPTNYRGLVALHVGVNFPRYERSVCVKEPVCSALERAGLFDRNVLIKGKADFSRLPFGGIFATARIIDCVAAAKNPTTALLERALGEDITEQYAFLLADLKPLKSLIPCNGALGLWKLSPSIAKQLQPQLSQAFDIT